MQPVSIEVSKEGVKFTCTGDIGSGTVQLRSNTNVENPKESVEIEMTEPVALTFSLKYLVNFCKASGLSDKVHLKLSSEVPLLVEYPLAEGTNSFLQFYLAPKVRTTYPTSSLNDADMCRSVTRSERGIILRPAYETHESGVGYGYGSEIFGYTCEACVNSTGMLDFRGCRGPTMCGVSVLEAITPPTPSRVRRPDNEKKSTIHVHLSPTLVFTILNFLDLTIPLRLTSGTRHGCRRVNTRDSRARDCQPCKSHSRIYREACLANKDRWFTGQLLCV